MARRFLSPQREQLTKAQLDELMKELEAMPKWRLEIYYKASHRACQYTTHLCSPRLIQELVAAWKAMRKR